MKKIAIVSLQTRGSQPVIGLEFTKALSKKARVLAAISSSVVNLADWRKLDVESLVEIRTPPKSPRVPWQYGLYALRSLRSIPDLVSLARKISLFDPDVLYWPLLHYWAPLINVLTPSIPKLIALQDPDFQQGVRSPVLKPLMRVGIRYTIGQAHRVIVLFQHAVEILEREGIPKEVVDVIPHGEFSYYARTYSVDSVGTFPTTGPTLLFFGNIVPHKGLDVLLKAFPLVKARIPRARLLIVGAGDLSPYAAMLNNSQDVTVINRFIADSEIPSYFAKSDVVVLPYLDASTVSGVIPLAYAFGKPVVATRVGGIPEQVIDGETGILVASQDVHGLAEACVTLLASPDLRKSMGQSGYRLAHSKWNWHRLADMILESCDKAAKGGRISDYRRRRTYS